MRVVELYVTVAKRSEDAVQFETLKCGEEL